MASHTVQASRARVRAAGMLLSGLLAACSGTIEPGENGPNGPGFHGGAANSGGAAHSGGGGASGSGGGGVGSVPGDPRIEQRVWRLSPEQLNAELHALFGDGVPELAIPETAGEYGITNIAANAVVDLGNASLFVDGARSVGTWVVTQGAAALRCSDYGSDGCRDTFLDWFPEAAFRRPVADAEQSELRTLFDALRSRYDFDFAVSGVVRAVLLSPEFLYRTELGVGGGPIMNPYEIASLLAFAITDEGPDAELLAAAESGELTQPDARETHARRLMAKSEKAWQRFFWEWLEMSTLYSQGAEVGLSDALVAQMEEEYRTFLREVIVNDRGTLRDVLSAPYTWAEPELAQLYGAAHPGGGVQRVELDPTQRGGLLTQGAWLVSHGKRGRDNVVRRGMNIFKHAMCNNDLVPPKGVNVQAELDKLVSPTASVREIVNARGNAAACGGCHKFPDPVGMVFESYASDARWQDTYPDGREVDTDVTVDGVGSFDNAPALSAALVDSEDFQRCFVRRFAHYLVGIDLGSPSMVAWTQAAQDSFAESDTSLEELLVALVRHPAFIERRMEDGQ